MSVCFITDAPSPLLISRPHIQNWPRSCSHTEGLILWSVSSFIMFDKIVTNVGNSVVQVGEVTEDCLNSAWVLFESLEKGIATATSLAAKAVNRNQIGYKRYNFRPLRYFIYCAILFHKYTHICFQRIAFNVYQKLGDVPAVFEGTRFANFACVGDFQICDASGAGYQCGKE